MDKTPTYGIPYLESSDFVADAPEASKSIAQGVEDALKIVDARTTPEGIAPVIALNPQVLGNQSGSMGQIGFVQSPSTGPNGGFGAYISDGNKWTALMDVTRRDLWWATQYKVLTWTKKADTNDVVSVSGIRLGDMLFIRVYWQNNGAFNKDAFVKVPIASVGNDLSSEECMFPCAENTGADRAGTGFLGINGHEIFWCHTDGGKNDIPEKMWHQGLIIAKSGN